MDLLRGKLNEKLQALVDAFGRHRDAIGLEGSSNMSPQDVPASLPPELQEQTKPSQSGPSFCRAPER